MWLPSVTQIMLRPEISDAREMYSVFRGSCGAKLGRPLMCEMLKKLHSIAGRFPSRCVVITSWIDRASDLLDPELFVPLFLLRPEELRLCLMAPHPLRRASLRADAASFRFACGSRIVLAKPVASLAQQTMLYYSDSVLLSATNFSASTTTLQACVVRCASCFQILSD